MQCSRRTCGKAGRVLVAPLAGVLGETPLQLEWDVCREFVAELTEQGMSTRAIAPIVGVNRETVAADIRGGRNLPPAQPMSRNKSRS